MTKWIICLGLGAVLVLSAGPARAAEWERPKIGLETEDGQHRISFHLAVQFRWEYLYADSLDLEERTSQSDVMFRRIRPVAKGHLFGDDLTWLLHLSVLPGAVELMDLWLDYRIHDWVQVKLGQFKIPFTRYRTNSFQDRPVVEWSFPTWYFGSERQLGVMLHNGVGNPPAFEFQLGVFNGVNARASNGVGLERVYAQPRPNMSNLVDPADLTDQMHAELVLHLAYNYGGIKVNRPADLEGGPPRFSVGFSLAWDLDPRPLVDQHMRLAPEAEFRWDGFALGGQLYLGLEDEVVGREVTKDDGSVVQRKRDYYQGLLGGLVYASYVFFEEYEIALRWARVSILADLRADAEAYALAQVAAATDEAERAALEDRFALTGALHSEQEFCLGFNWYLYGTTLKWQSDLGLILRERDDGDRLDAFFRTQLQLAF